MKIYEIMPTADADGRRPLPEMAFPRKDIVDTIRNYMPRIAEHAVKIILFPQSKDVSHWKGEITGWAKFLSKLRLKSNNKPMGYALAYKYLYDGPFGGNEIGMTQHFIEMAELSHNVALTVDTADVHATLKEFLTHLAVAIGDGKDVRPVINSL